MAKPRVTFSKAELAAKCGWWAHSTTECPPATFGAAAARGTDFHLKAEVALMTLGKEVSPDIAGWWDDFCLVVPCSLKELAAEVAMAYNPRTDQAQILEIVDRAYPDLGPDWICGTLDILGPGYVADHKTSFAFENVTEPQKNGQLGIAALCVRALQGVSEVRVEIHYPGDDLVPGVWRLRRVNSHVLTHDELEAWRNAYLRVIDERAATEAPEPREGAHCQTSYCPAYAVCPKTQSRASGLVPVERLTGIVTSADKLREGLDTLHAAQAVLKEFERRLKVFAEASGESRIDLEDGTSYVYIAAGERRYTDNDKVRDLVGEEAFKRVQFTKKLDGFWKRAGKKKDLAKAEKKEK